MGRNSAARLAALALLLGIAPLPSFAYRPFDSTDAEVAGDGTFDLEFAPAGWRREGPERFRIAPAVIANLGLAGERELVIQGQRETALDAAPGTPRTALVDNGLFVKQVLRQGVLQDAPGWSVATECGFLLPATHGESGTGFSVAGIASQRGAAGTLHLNADASYTREHKPELFLGAILEGPHDWPVRPVAELFSDQTSGGAHTRSVLAGAIWQAREGLSFDVGFRGARTNGEPVHEARLGLTWSFAFKER